MKIYILSFCMLIQFIGFSKNETKESEPKKEMLVPNYILNGGFIKTAIEGKELLLGIPKAMLEKPMLFVKHKYNNDIIYKHVIWQQVDNLLYLIMPRVESSSKVIIPVDDSSYIDKKIIGAFPVIQSKSNQNIFWINATSLFFDKTLISLDGSSENHILIEYSSIRTVRHLKDELVVETMQVKSKKNKSWKENIDYNLYLLPEPMKARAYDHRMGFFPETKSRTNFRGSKAENTVANITRWRLEKKNKNKSISIPVKPITIVIPFKVPKKWVPYIKAGILDWLPAFEAAGFKNAIEVKIASKENTDLEINSIYNSKIIWGNHRGVRGFENVHGGTVSQVIDIRTGEILKVNIFIPSTPRHLIEDYFVRCAPMDSRVLEFPYSEELVGALLRELTSHETGHALGLMDGNYGEYTYPFEKMRDLEWLQTMGYTPSVMTYARENYIVQPEDSIPPYLLIQHVGPTDLYSIKWGYKPFYGISQEAEKDSLEALIRDQDSIPWYRFHLSSHEVVGPGATNEVIENRNPIESTKLGLKNMERVVHLFPKVNKSQKNYAMVDRLYKKTLKLWFDQMRHVLSLVGGYEMQNKSGSQKGNVYTPLPASEQHKGLDFFVVNAFSPPKWLVYPKALKKIEYTTYPDELMDYQIKLLYELIGAARFKRLEYMEVYGVIGISGNLVLDKLQSDLFRELEGGPQIKIESRRQELQRKYIEIALGVISQKSGKLNTVANIGYNNKTKSLWMESLLSLKKKLNLSLEKAVDKGTYGHIKLLLLQLVNIE